MSVRVRYFASIREALGAGDEVPLPVVPTVAELRDHLIACSAEHGRVLARGRAVRCALNQVLADETETLRDGDEVAFFPPVTGG